MRITAIVLVVLMLAAVSVEGASSPVPLRMGGRARIALVEQGAGELHLRATLGGMSAVVVGSPAGDFTRLDVLGSVTTREVGAPALPLLTRLIALPHGAKARVVVDSQVVSELGLAAKGLSHPLWPAQAPVPKNQDPAAQPFARDAAAYAVREVGRELVRVVPCGRLRGLDLARVEVAPVSWRPADGTLQATESVDFRVVFAGGDAKAERELQERTASPFFAPLYAQVAGAKGLHDAYPDLVADVVTMAVVTPPEFLDTLADYVRWQTERGFHVLVGIIGTPEVGSTAEEIQAWLHGLYTDPPAGLPAPSFVVLVGDVEQVPTFQWTHDLGYLATDRPYAAADGDLIPDMYYGRISVVNPSQLHAVLDKILAYEQLTMPDPSYLDKGVLVAGVDATYSPTYCNGQMNYATSLYFDAAHGIDPHAYLYPASANQAAEIVADVSAGAGFVNYTGHGSIMSWSNPRFSQGDIIGLDNADRYPLVVGNCCSTMGYATAECFGESWLRAPGKGAVGYIGGSDLTYWDEDYWWAVGSTAVISANPTYEMSGLGIFDGLFHDHGEGDGQWYVTAGAVAFCGNLAVQEAGSSLSDYYWNVYGLLGDPSLVPYLGVPADNPVSHPAWISTAQTSLDLAAAPYSYAGLSRDGTLLGSGTAGAAGDLVLDLAAAPDPGAPLHLVVTAPNRRPYVAEVPVEAPAQVTIEPDPLTAGVPANLTVTVREADGITPKVGLEVWAEGLDYTTAPVLTDDAGVAALPVNYPYGPALDVIGREPGQGFRQFTRSVVVLAQPLVAPDLRVTTAVGLADAFAAGWPGTLHAVVAEPGALLYARLPDGTLLSTSADSLVLIPAAAGQVVATIAVAGCDLYSETFPVRELFAGGVLVLDDTAGTGRNLAHGDQTDLEMDLQLLGYRTTKQTLAETDPAFWPSYDLLVVNCARYLAPLADPALRDSLIAYVERGGHLLIEGGELAHLYAAGDPEFARTVLRVSAWSGDDGGIYALMTTPGHPVVSVPNVVQQLGRTSYTGPGDQDVVTETAEAQRLAIWSAAIQDAALIAYDPTPSPDGGQLIYFPFNYALTVTEVRRDLLENAVRWLLTDDTGTAAVSGPLQADVVGGGVRLSWQYDPQAVDGCYLERRSGDGPALRLTATPLTSPEGRIVYLDSVAGVAPGSRLRYSYVLVAGGREIGRGEEIEVLYQPAAPAAFLLHAAYPNPFNPRTQLRFDLPRAGRVALRIYDVRGRLVRTLVDEVLPAAVHQRSWDGTDTDGRRVASGVYYARLNGPDGVATRKLLLLK